MRAFVDRNDDDIGIACGKEIARRMIRSRSSAVPFPRRKFFGIGIAACNDAYTGIFEESCRMACRLLALFIETERKADPPRTDYRRSIFFFATHLYAP